MRLYAFAAQRRAASPDLWQISQVAVFTFKHAFVGKAGSAPGTASAHVNYISRKSATCYQEAFGIPSKPRQTAAQTTWRFLDEREASIRKNGRVCDKFIIAVPVEMKQEEAIGLLRAFGQKIGCRYDAEQGRLLKAPFFFTLQDWGSHNPHAHFVFVDADRESGERVFGTTKKGSTERLRAAWEETANAELERLGYEARIDRRPQRVIDAELEATVIGPADGSPQVHTEGLPEEVIQDLSKVTDSRDKLDNIPISEAPPHAPTDQLEEPATEAQADHIVEPNEKVSDRLPEPDMTREEQLDAIRQELDEQDNKQERQPEQPGRIVAGRKPVSVAGKVKGSIELAKRGKELRAARSRLQTALDWGGRANEAAATATVAYNQLQDDTDRFNKNHRGLFGRGLAGVNVLGFKLFGRKKAEAAQRRVEVGQRTYKALYDAHTEKARIAEREESATRADQQRIEGYASMTPEQRREALKGMAQAAEIIDQSQADTLKGVTGEQVYEAFKRGELTADEAQEACHWLGDRAQAARIAQEAELEEEQELGM